MTRNFQSKDTLLMNSKLLNNNSTIDVLAWRHCHWILITCYECYLIPFVKTWKRVLGLSRCNSTAQIFSPCLRKGLRKCFQEFLGISRYILLSFQMYPLRYDFYKKFFYWSNTFLYCVFVISICCLCHSRFLFILLTIF